MGETTLIYLEDFWYEKNDKKYISKIGKLYSPVRICMGIEQGIIVWMYVNLK